MASTDTIALPTAADVDAAAKRIAGVAIRTPLVNSPVLDARLGARVFLKAETLQRTGSFKFRGAYNKISSIPQERKANGVVAYSSGNHAQGVAHAAQLCGVPAVIVMPSDAPKAKRERTAALGAEVVLYDRDTEDRAAIARDIAQKRGAVLVSPFDDPLIIAGQGTAGREICEDLDEARREARHGGGRRLGRRADRRHRARHEGARAGREVLLRRAGGLRRHPALVQERQARAQSADERHDLRRADDRDAGRRHLGDQQEAGRRRASWRATTRSAARWRSRSAN